MGALDKYFGGGRGDAQRALERMKRTYGPKDGEHVFRAKVAKAKRRERRKPRIARP